VKEKRRNEEMESRMRRRIWIGLFLVVLTSISALWFFGSYVTQPSEAGFRIYSLQNNALLISDADILSYNWTSQEMTITPEASGRLTETGDLYSFTGGFVIKIDGEEIYRGIFREYTMSAIPTPPKISILFPSASYPFESVNRGAMRMFFPSFQPPSDQPVNNAEILNYFEKINKLE
jgi:hypothetical protein